MGKDYYRGSGTKGLLRNLSFIVFGFVLFFDPFAPYNAFNIGFGVIVCLLIGWLYKIFLRLFLVAVNKELRQNLGKGVIYMAVDNAMLFLIPFAVMVAVATYLLNWHVGTVFMSAAFMIVGTSAAIEVGRLLDKPSMRNTVAASAVAFMFSAGIINVISKLSFVPGILEGVLMLIPTLIQGGVF